jgi:hypothetical protein
MGFRERCRDNPAKSRSFELAGPLNSISESLACVAAQTFFEAQPHRYVVGLPAQTFFPASQDVKHQIGGEAMLPRPLGDALAPVAELRTGFFRGLDAGGVVVSLAHVTGSKVEWVRVDESDYTHFSD